MPYQDIYLDIFFEFFLVLYFYKRNLFPTNQNRYKYLVYNDNKLFLKMGRPVLQCIILLQYTIN